MACFGLDLGAICQRTSSLDTRTTAYSIYMKSAVRYKPRRHLALVKVDYPWASLSGASVPYVSDLRSLAELGSLEFHVVVNDVECVTWRTIQCHYYSVLHLQSNLES